MLVLRSRAHAAVFALLACRARRESAPDDSTGAPAESAPQEVSSRAPTSAPTVIPVRAAEGSQPRWRYTAHGERPRGRERWRFDLTPREASGEPATDGRTVYVTAVRLEREGPTDGEVYAFDLLDGTLRWHTPVGGLHGEPVEFFDRVVVVDTIPHCHRRGPETPGVTTRPCEETAPGGVVGLDASTGRELFRTTAASDSVRARWTASLEGSRAWIHDGPGALRPVALPTGALGARLVTRGAVLNLTVAGSELIYTSSARNGGTTLTRRAAGTSRPRWERALPLRTHCPVLSAGPMLLVPAFQASNVVGASRGLLASTGVDVWSAHAPAESVATCSTLENGVMWQVVDGALTSHNIADGRPRARLALPSTPTSDMAVAVDGIFYVSVRGRLVGVDTNSGHVAVSVVTEATASEGLVVWGGRGVTVTREPGLVVGFD